MINTPDPAPRGPAATGLADAACPLCAPDAPRRPGAAHPPGAADPAGASGVEPPGTLWRDEVLRVVRVDDTPIPGFTRVIWNTHVAEMTDLDTASRSRLMRAVWLVEDALRGCLHPDKINLASLGNQVPHLHWHIVPRWREDPFFPASPWSAPTTDPARLAAWEARRARLLGRIDSFHRALVEALEAGASG